MEKGEVPVIVATNAFGMRIDKPDVRIVVHFDIPDSPGGLFPGSRRAGREFGKKAYAVLLYNEAAFDSPGKKSHLGFPLIKLYPSGVRLLGDFFGLE